MNFLKSKNPKTLGPLAAVWLILAYIFASFAVDTGNFLNWLLAVLFAGWAIVEASRALRYIVKK